MKDGRKWPEIFVDINFIHRSDIINKLLRVDQEIFNINYDHPVLGQVVEVFKIVDNKTMVLKSVYPVEYQEGIDQIDVVKDYYNNFILDGHETYLEYYNEEVGYFLLSRNVKETQGVF